MAHTLETSANGPTEVLVLDDALNPFIRQAVAYWRAQTGARCFPKRSDMTLRGLAPVLPYTVILSVIDGGADYEYRYVGDAQRAAFKASFKGVRVSQIEQAAPEIGGMLRGVYEQVRSSGAALLIRGDLPPGLEDTKYLYHETVFLPLGAGEAVDHLLIVGVQLPKPYWDLPDEKLKTLQKQVGAVPSPD